MYYKTIYLIIIITITLASARVEFPEDMVELIAHLHNTCVSSTGVTEDDINNCEKGIFADKRELKCYMFCFFEEASLTDDDDVVDYDTLIGMIPEHVKDRVETMINACRHLDTPGGDKCEKAFSVHQCLYKTDPDIYFLF